MPKHEIKVTEFTERHGDHFTGRPASTLGGIVVQPPISTGEHFTHAVLGQEKHGVNLFPVVTTKEATVFVAESSVGASGEERQIAIHTIASRIRQLANAPERVITLMNDNPFPRPQERW